MTSTAELSKHFTLIDYIIFVLMLIVSASIGFYYACTGNRQRTASEYLMANRNMGVIPISLSLLASFISAISFLSTPMEIYTFGTSYWCMVFAFPIAMPLSAYVFLPVFYDLQLTSAYEYLEKRFNHFVRKLGSIVFIIQMIIYLAIANYAPALALSQVTGIHVWGSVAAIGVVCTLYTTMGGMKAVIMTDCLQTIVMLSSILAVIIQGIIELDGLQTILDIADKGGRLNTFNFDINPTVRYTFWNLSIGACFLWLSIYGVNQTQVQRYLTAGNIRTAQRSIWFNCIALFLIISIYTLTGLVLYAYYSKCDPLTEKIINAPDQLLPLLVMQIFGKYPGLPGFFVAGLFSSSLSTLSSGLNSLAAVTLEDFIQPIFYKSFTDERAGLVSKFLAFGYGALSVVLVLLVEQLGTVLQAAMSIVGMIGGPLLGVFCLGMLFPWANSLGAIIGFFMGFSLILWIGLGAQIVKPALPTLSMSIEGCASNNTILPSLDYKEVFPIYTLSYQWYSFVAVFSVIIFGVITSFLTGYQNPEKLDARLFAPQLRKLFSFLSNDLRNKLHLNLNIPAKKQHERNENNKMQITSVQDFQLILKENEANSNHSSHF